MSLHLFQENFREWIVRVFDDRFDLLDRSVIPRSLYARNTEPPPDAKSQGKELVYRIYLLYSPPSPGAGTPKRSLEKALRRTRDLTPFILSYAEEGTGQDNVFFHLISDIDLEEVARIYLNYNHQRVARSVHLARFLIDRIRSHPGEIPEFKIAGPKVDRNRRDSIVIYLSESGLRRMDAWLPRLPRLARWDADVPYGTRPLYRGIGFCFEPLDQMESSGWLEWASPLSTSFGILMACFLARALIEASDSIDAFSLRLHHLMIAHGINPLELYKLSPELRVPCQHPLLQEGWLT